MSSHEIEEQDQFFDVVSEDSFHSVESAESVGGDVTGVAASTSTKNLSDSSESDSDEIFYTAHDDDDDVDAGSNSANSIHDDAAASSSSFSSFHDDRDYSSSFVSAIHEDSAASSSLASSTHDEETTLSPKPRGWADDVSEYYGRGVAYVHSMASYAQQTVTNGASAYYHTGAEYAGAAWKQAKNTAIGLGHESFVSYYAQETQAGSSERDALKTAYAESVEEFLESLTKVAFSSSKPTSYSLFGSVLKILMQNRNLDISALSRVYATMIQDKRKGRLLHAVPGEGKDLVTDLLTDEDIIRSLFSQFKNNRRALDYLVEYFIDSFGYAEKLAGNPNDKESQHAAREGAKYIAKAYLHAIAESNIDEKLIKEIVEAFYQKDTKSFNKNLVVFMNKYPALIVNVLQSVSAQESRQFIIALIEQNAKVGIALKALGLSDNKENTDRFTQILTTFSRHFLDALGRMDRDDISRLSLSLDQLLDHPLVQAFAKGSGAVLTSQVMTQAEQAVRRGEEEIEARQDVASSINDSIEVEPTVTPTTTQHDVAVIAALSASASLLGNIMSEADNVKQLISIVDDLSLEKYPAAGRKMLRFIDNLDQTAVGNLMGAVRTHKDVFAHLLNEQFAAKQPLARMRGAGDALINVATNTHCMSLMTKMSDAALNKHWPKVLKYFILLSFKTEESASFRKIIRKVAANSIRSNKSTDSLATAQASSTSAVGVGQSEDASMQADAPPPANNNGIVTHSRRTGFRAAESQEPNVVTGRRASPAA